jgi:hypothetical protein
MKFKLLFNFCLLAWSSPALLYTSGKTQVPVNTTGTYILVSVDNIKPDGSRVHLYGDNPQGLLMLDNSAHYSLQIMRESRPNFAAGDKNKGTDEENRAAVQGCNTHYGKYVADGEKHTITFFIEHASFPNWENTQQTRPFEFDGKTLKYTVPAPTTGGVVTGEVIWRRN